MSSAVASWRSQKTALRNCKWAYSVFFFFSPFFHPVILFLFVALSYSLCTPSIGALNATASPFEFFKTNFGPPSWGGLYKGAALTRVYRVVVCLLMHYLKQIGWAWFDVPRSLKVYSRAFLFSLSHWTLSKVCIDNWRNILKIVCLVYWPQIIDVCKQN